MSLLKAHPRSDSLTATFGPSPLVSVPGSGASRQKRCRDQIFVDARWSESRRCARRKQLWLRATKVAVRIARRAQRGCQSLQLPRGWGFDIGATVWGTPLCGEHHAGAPGVGTSPRWAELRLRASRRFTLSVSPTRAACSRRKLTQEQRPLQAANVRSSKRQKQQPAPAPTQPEQQPRSSTLDAHRWSRLGGEELQGRQVVRVSESEESNVGVLR